FCQFALAAKHEQHQTAQVARLCRDELRDSMSVPVIKFYQPAQIASLAPGSKQNRQKRWNTFEFVAALPVPVEQLLPLIGDPDDVRHGDHTNHRFDALEAFEGF